MLGFNLKGVDGKVKDADVLVDFTLTGFTVGYWYVLYADLPNSTCKDPFNNNPFEFRVVLFHAQVAVRRLYGPT